MTSDYDLIVIGSGPAGQSAAELAAFLGHSALIVEQGRPGGVVTTTGGAPTKTLREAALALAGNGLTLAEALPLIRERTLEVSRSLQAVIARQIEARGIDYVQGTARIGSNRTVTINRADGERLEVAARTIVLSPGSKPVRFAGIPFDDPDIFDSDEIFLLRRTPANLVIVGGGPVGVEFATIFTALGVPVTLVDKSERLLPNMDGELARLLSAEFERRGVRLIQGAGVESASRVDGRLTIRLSNGARVDADTVLFAAGRTANTDGLGLETAGVDVDQRGWIVVDRYYRTTSPCIYAVGDAIGPTLASIAMQQGRAAICHALGLVFGVPVDRAASAAVYGLPEIAGVGITEEQIKSADTPYVIGRCDLARTARGAIAGRGGRLKLIVRADDRTLVGVHCIGDIASEIVGLGHAVLHMGGAVDVLLTLALNTPTYCSAYRDAAIDAMGQLAVLAGHAASVPVPAMNAVECGPWPAGDGR